MSSPPSTAADEIAHQFRFFRVHKDGRIVLNLPPLPTVPPSDTGGVRSKDVVISTDPHVTARLFLPEASLACAGSGKLPVLLYIHGGGFCMHSPSTPAYHKFVAAISAAAGVISVSVDYGLFPARPIPACYDDSWAALQWIAARSDPWIATQADLSRVFIAGDSAGGNITHDLVSRVGRVGSPGLTVSGAVLIHPYFGGTVDDHMVMYMWPENKGLSDPRMRPGGEDLAAIGCGKVLVFVAEKDSLAGPGKRYVEDLRTSGWKGSVELYENVGEDHCFLFINPDFNYEKTVALLNKFVSFIQEE